MAAERRKRLKVLPPHRRLSESELVNSGNTSRPGEWFKIPLPPCLNSIRSAEFGAEWLTDAFHAAGTLPSDNAVVEILSFVELDLQGDDAQVRLNARATRERERE